MAAARRRGKLAYLDRIDARNHPTRRRSAGGRQPRPGGAAERPADGVDGDRTGAHAHVHLGGQTTGLTLEAVHRIDGTGQQVRTTLEFIGTGPLAWLGSLLAGSRVRAYLDMESAGLKRAAETT
ncbi:hypothetical protein I552_8448 [Mycobacterium xenopi 3993]|nr:hypothetical protein I552_8448 [Mycobacterium xenopi 3993]